MSLRLSVTPLLLGAAFFVPADPATAQVAPPDRGPAAGPGRHDRRGHAAGRRERRRGGNRRHRAARARLGRRRHPAGKDAQRRRRARDRGDQHQRIAERARARDRKLARPRRRAAGAPAQRPADLELPRASRHPDRGDPAGRDPARGGRAQIWLPRRPACREHRPSPALPFDRCPARRQRRDRGRLCRRQAAISPG